MPGDSRVMLTNRLGLAYVLASSVLPAHHVLPLLKASCSRGKKPHRLTGPCKPPPSNTPYLRPMQLMSTVHRPCSALHASMSYDNKIIVLFGGILQQFPQSRGVDARWAAKAEADANR